MEMPPYEQIYAPAVSAELYGLTPEELQVTIEDVITEIWYDSAYNVIRRFTYTYQTIRGRFHD